MILLTGSRGFLGKRLAKKLTNAVGIDLRDGKNLITCTLPANIDLIYHLAAQSSVESSWSDPVHDMDNIRMTARLVKMYPDAKIIYANSAASIDPKSPYGFSKKCSGDYIKLFHKNYVSLVFPNVYGEGSKSVVDIFKRKQEVTIYGDGNNLRDYVHVDDIVEGLLKAQNWPKGEYCMGSGIPTRVIDLAKRKAIHFAPPRKEAKESVLTNTTPHGEWTPKINVMEYLCS